MKHSENIEKISHHATASHSVPPDQSGRSSSAQSMSSAHMHVAKGEAMQGHPHHRLPLSGRFLVPHGRNMEGPHRFYAREGVDPLSEAFEAKITVHPGMGGKPVARETQSALIDALTVRESSGKRMAYIHVPFCKMRCLYCSFFQEKYQPEQSAVYTDALIAELDIWQGRAIQEATPLHAVYLGGGTPTALAPHDLGRLLAAVRNRLPLANDCEITVEGSAADLDEALIEAALENGANRFSLGVQTFETSIRRAMGRRSSCGDMARAISRLQSYDQASVVIDLIYGLPDQDMAVWQNDLRTAHSLNLDGLDCYQLGVHKDSPLQKSIERGSVSPAASSAFQGGMYAVQSRFFEDAQYRRLSISHWGRTPRERNLYNTYTKSGVDCLGFGPGAGGNLHGHMTYNQPDYKAWLGQVQQGVKPIAMMMAPVERHRLNKALGSGLEQGVLDLASLEDLCATQKYAKLEARGSLRTLLEPLLQQWERAGLLVSGSTSCRLTVAGQFWYINMTQLLIEYIDEKVAQ